MASLLPRRHPVALQTYASPERVNGKNKLRGLVAAGQKIGRSDRDGTLRRLIQPWQYRSFGYYDTLGEIKYAAQFYSRSLSKLRLYAAEEDDSGELEESKDPTAIEMLNRIRDPGGGRSQLLSQYGRLMFLTGETYLLVSRDLDTDEEQWEFLSTDELRIDGSGTYTRQMAPNVGVQSFTAPPDDGYEPLADDEAVAYRIWRRHPRFSALADSTMHGVLDICEELLLLTQVIRARARSRIAGAGLLLVPNNVGPPPPEVSPDEDPLEDPFIADLVEAMTAPISDEGSASSVVPMLVRGEQEALDAVRHLQIVDPTQLYPETGLRMELIRRLGIGLDLPPEILLGLQDSNHWSAWQVDEQTWKAHLQPVAQYLVDDLSSAYFRPSLRDAGVNDWQRFTIAYDPAEVINHPDRTTDAKDLHDRVVIGDEALREAAGFDDDDAPSEEEVARRVGILTRDATLAMTGEVKPPTPPPEPAGTNPDDTADEGDSGAPEVEPGAPVTRQSNTNGREAVTSSLEVAKILGAADLSLRRAREKAGARLLSLARRDPELTKRLRSVRTSQVAYELGSEVCERKLHAPEPRELVAGASELLGEALKAWGIEDESVANFVGEMVERHAARTLYDECPAALPPAFVNHLAELTTSGL